MPKPKHSHRNKNKPKTTLALLKAVLAASAAVLLLIVTFTGALYMEWLPESSIPLLNSIFKVIGAVLAGFIIGRSGADRMWLMGGLAGAAFQVLATGCMGIFLGALQLRVSLVGDLLLAAVVGAALAYATAALRARQSK